MVVQIGQYRDIETVAPDYQPMDFYSSDGEQLGEAEWLAGQMADAKRW